MTSKTKTHSKNNFIQNTSNNIQSTTTSISNVFILNQQTIQGSQPLSSIMYAPYLNDKNSAFKLTKINTSANAQNIYQVNVTKSQTIKSSHGNQYRCYPRKFLLNNWEVDVGYPQNILISQNKRRLNTLQQNLDKRNYLKQNIRRVSQGQFIFSSNSKVQIIKNKGSEISKEKKNTKSNVKQVDKKQEKNWMTGKILEYKKKQKELQENTKINLKQQMKIQVESVIKKNINDHESQKNLVQRLIKGTNTKQQQFYNQKCQTEQIQEVLGKKKFRNPLIERNYRRSQHSNKFIRTSYYQKTLTQTNENNINKLEPKRYFIKAQCTRRLKTANIQNSDSQLSHKKQSNKKIKQNIKNRIKKQLYKTSLDNNHQIQQIPSFQTYNQHQPQILTTQRKKFKQIIHKFNNYDSIFIGKLKKDQLNKQLSQQFIIQKYQQNQNLYKQKQLQMNLRKVNIAAKKINLQWQYSQNAKLQVLQDLERIDPQYYQELKKHRGKRLKLLKQDLGIYQNLQKQQKEVFSEKKSVKNINQIMNPVQNNIIIQNPANKHTQPILSSKLIQLNKISNQTNKKKHRYIPVELAKFQKIRQFLNNLYTLLDKAYRFNIPETHYYSALLKLHVQYESQGSYILFNSIQSNNFQLVTGLIQNNRQLLYNVDQYQRTPLIYAAQLNRTKICMYLAGKGCNFDFLTTEGKSALYWAVYNQNYELAQCILRKGASPWSNERCVYKKLGGRWQILMKNAKRIWMVMALCRLGKRKKLWEKLNVRINGDQVIRTF